MLGNVDLQTVALYRIRYFIAFKIKGDFNKEPSITTKGISTIFKEQCLFYILNKKWY